MKASRGTCNRNPKYFPLEVPLKVLYTNSMKNKEFIQAVINHYKTSIKRLGIPGVYLSKTGRLLKNGTNGDVYSIIKHRGLIDGNNDIKNYVFCGSEFNTLWKVNKAEIKKIFLEKKYYFTNAFAMYGQKYYDQWK